MVEPGETKVKTEGIEEKKNFMFKKKIKRTILRNALIKMCQSY